MKNKLLLKIKNLKVNLFILFFSLFLFGFGQSDSRFCGNVENFEFSNGHETVHITDDETYIFDDLPGHFYVKVDVNGYVQSVKYNVTNLDTNEQFEVIENLIPYTFPAGDADWNIGLGTFEVIASIYAQNNAYGYVCDTESVTFTLTDNVACTADAGTLTAVYSSVALSNGEAQLSATPNGDVHVPADFSKIFVLTSGSDLVIEQVNATPNFTVTEAGNYTIHTLVYPSDLDLSIVELGVTTGFDVNSLLIQGGGDLCASLDVAGAPIHVGEEPCTAYAGTLTVVESTVCSTGEVTISATSNGDANEPAGFSTLFVLTSGDDLVIEQVGGSPEFTVVGGGDYTIHTLVYPETLDLSIVELGVTTGFDVNSLLIQGGGDLCGSLDVAGAPVQIINPDAGTLTAVDSSVELSNGEAQLSATTNGDVNVPSGYSSIFVLTSGDDLVIEQVGGSPEVTVTEA
ncbi:hypothetical protein, partial [uncultured Winogradskyella sp.]|uniref:hypothetical protein n=1 Tax=uncultured Winogradskyella sp. TaxID=395353 RepID=UPI00262F2D53